MIFNTFAPGADGEAVKLGTVKVGVTNSSSAGIEVRVCACFKDPTTGKLVPGTVYEYNTTPAGTDFSIPLNRVFAISVMSIQNTLLSCSYLSYKQSDFDFLYIPKNGNSILLPLFIGSLKADNTTIDFLVEDKV